MNEDPMSLFSRSHSGKSNKEHAANSQSVAPSSQSLPDSKSDKMEIPSSLPENWRAKIEEMTRTLKHMHEMGSRIPQRHNMNEHEFEAFMNNPANFTQDEWAAICQARDQARKFTQQMKEILDKLRPLIAPKKPKKRKGISQNWISVD